MGRSRVRTSTAILDKQALWRDLVHRDQCISVCNFLCNFWTNNLRQTVAIYYNPLQGNTLFKHPLCASSSGTFCTLRPEGGCWDVELALNPGIVSGFWVLLGWWGRMISHTNGALDLEQPIWPIKHIGKRSSFTRCWPGFTTSIVLVSTLTNYFRLQYFYSKSWPNVFSPEPS